MQVSNDIDMRPVNLLMALGSHWLIVLLSFSVNTAAY